ncbi:cytochrome P450 [Streptomyces luteogriseus]|uniref:cytochrome P450 n=1 Tax=Streptomyces luteogriseus TaxID=68233 RepID=UPI0026197CB6|nr:cytochrome P450 [uncultured Streptomyces sp.]
MSTATDPTGDLGLPAYPAARSARCPLDLPAEYEQWRLGDGLQKVRLWNGETAWVVTRHEDVKFVLSDQRISADTIRYPRMHPGGEQQQVPAFPRMDDPEHARIRLMLTKDFTVKRMEAMRPQVRAMVDRFIDEMTAKGDSADLVASFALPMPSLVISLLLGVPYEDHEFFQKHSITINQPDVTPQEKSQASAELFGFLLELVQRKQREPGDDLISRLIAERVETGELQPEEVAMNGLVLLIAGHETTANMIGLGTLTLLEHPEQAAVVRDSDDPKVVANAIEELLRYLSIAQDMIWRAAHEDVVIGGQEVKAGDIIAVNLPAANHDPSFMDNAGSLDITRSTRGHIAFGYGIHQCLGQNLARVELTEALPRLLRRLPGLRLAVPLEEIPFRGTMAAFGVHELPVTW